MGCSNKKNYLIPHYNIIAEYNGIIKTTSRYLLNLVTVFILAYINGMTTFINMTLQDFYLRFILGSMIFLQTSFHMIPYAFFLLNF